MKFIFSYVKKYRWMVTGVILLKIAATFLELLLPYILEHLIDKIAPTKSMPQIVFWGVMMIALAFAIRFLNVKANRNSVKVSQNASYELRRDLFWRSVNLSGSQMDEFGLPSLTSRMTADSYNAVSYTHLDVYKRQPQRMHQARRDGQDFVRHAVTGGTRQAPRRRQELSCRLFLYWNFHRKI